MSKVTVKVTRAGLTRCSSCHTHVHYAEAVESGACPACGEAFDLARAPGVGVNLSGVARATRSGALAVALLGAAACGSSDEEGGSDAGMVEDGSGAGDLDAGMSEDGSGDGDLDGGMTEDGSGEADLDVIDVEIEEVEEAGPSDVYGAPPDAG